MAVNDNCTCYRPWMSVLPAPPCGIHAVPWAAQPVEWVTTVPVLPAERPEHRMVTRARKYVLRGKSGRGA